MKNLKLKMIKNIDIVFIFLDFLNLIEFQINQNFNILK